MTVTMHENIITLSTWSQPRDTMHQRYVSSEHAVRRYLRARNRLQGEKAIDYESMIDRVQTSRKPDTSSDWIDEKITIERILRPIAMQVGPEHWKIWELMRVEKALNGKYTYRQVPGISKSHAHRIVKRIDGLFEEALEREGRLVRNAVGAE